VGYSIRVSNSLIHWQIKARPHLNWGEKLRSEGHRASGELKGTLGCRPCETCLVGDLSCGIKAQESIGLPIDTDITRPSCDILGSSGRDHTIIWTTTYTLSRELGPAGGQRTVPVHQPSTEIWMDNGQGNCARRKRRSCRLSIPTQR
jgi:hypothetical protein